MSSAGVQGLDIDITKAGRHLQERPLPPMQVMAASIVNACTYRDANAALRIDDLNTQPLRDVISPQNPADLHEPDPRTTALNQAGS